jgi:hypothetical protein
MSINRAGLKHITVAMDNSFRLGIQPGGYRGCAAVTYESVPF